MIKQMSYPKTKRFSDENRNYIITEKLDGSNLGFGVKDKQLYIFQRNNVFTLDEIDKVSYKGLKEWVNLYKDDLINSIYEGSIVFGEWLGMGKLNYNFENRFFIFAKARFGKMDNEQVEIINLIPNYHSLQYVFNEQKIPSYISLVPFVCETSVVDLNFLDELYYEYTNEVWRNVEGFVIYSEESERLRKYVRYKNGKKTEHIVK